jgi:Zn-dependent peptidase ImmA (M78 family)
MIKRVGSVDPAIARRADEVLRKSGYPRLHNHVGIDLERIVSEYYRLQLRYHPDLKFNGRSLLAAYIPSFPFLFVHRGCMTSRQRFSIAHELGHAELEDDFGPAEALFAQKEAFLCSAADIEGEAAAREERRCGRRRRREIRANQFAVRLLMPDGLVRETWRTCFDICRTAELLGVSMESLRYRLQELGLISESVPRRPRLAGTP